MTALLEIEALGVRYGRAPRAVQAFSLQMQPGAAIGLVGESGSGKSTIAAAVLGLLGRAGRLEAGHIRFRGDDLSGMGPGKRRALLGSAIGAVFQDPFTALTPTLRVGPQIAEPLIRHRGVGRAEARERVEALLAELGIPRPRDFAAAYPHELSGGMRQRALIAAAVVCEPDLLILDEPTTALDVTVEAQILDLLVGLRTRRGMAMLFISHNLAVVRAVCDEVAVLYAGQVMEQGRAAELLRRPAHPYTRGLVGALPRLDGARRRLTPIPGETEAGATGCPFAARCPFAEPRCGLDSVALAPVEASSAALARCWKLPATLALPWPGEPGAKPASASPPGPVLVAATGLRRGFTRSGAGTWRWPWRAAPRRMAVDGVDLAIQAGEVLGLVGESGSGKSTLGRLLLHLAPADSGAVAFDGMQPAHLPRRALRLWRRQAQMVFQNPGSSLNPRRTVGRILARPLALCGVAASARAEAVADILRRVRLPAAHAGRRPDQLSGGEKQRVSIARALATRPRFIVLDEPVSALDVSVQAAVLNLLLDLRAEAGLTYLFISHDLAVVATVADRVAVMLSGAIVELGPTGRVMDAPCHPYTRVLLSSVPGSGRVRVAMADRGKQPGGDAVAEAGCRFQARCPSRIGAVCDTVAPPLRLASPGHSFACHLERGLVA